MASESDKNLWTAIALSFLIMMGFNYYEVSGRADVPSAQTSAVASEPEPEKELLARAEALTLQPQRTLLQNNTVKMSVSWVGDQVDDWTLTHYAHKLHDQEPYALLSPAYTQQARFLSVGWKAPDGLEGVVPDAEAVWDVTESTDTKVTLKKEINGVQFLKTFELDDRFLLTITQRVLNESKSSVRLMCAAALISECRPDDSKFMGFFHEKIKEFSYESMKKETKIKEKEKFTWAGIADKYWLMAFIPTEKSTKGKWTYTKTPCERWTMEMHDPLHTLKPGEHHEKTFSCLLGPKDIHVLEEYSQKIPAPKLDLAIEFGWFYIITKPLLFFLSWLKMWTGSFAAALLLLTVIMKVAFFPLANSSLRSMARMRALQPDLENIRATWAHDKIRMNQEIVNLYQREKINPVAGCIPMLVQIPIFFALYKVLSISIEMRHAPFFGWIDDLSAPDPTSLWNGFGLLPWNPFPFLSVGLWPLLMGITMAWQQRLSPQQPGADAGQQRMMNYMMPVMLTYMLAGFPVGLVIYWTWSNILAILQQYFVQKKA